MSFLPSSGGICWEYSATYTTGNMVAYVALWLPLKIFISHSIIVYCIPLYGHAQHSLCSSKERLLTHTCPVYAKEHSFHIWQVLGALRIH